MSTLVCDRCKTLLPGALVNHAELLACPGCFAPVRARVFPAFGRALVAGAAPEAVLSDEDASCFYHPAKKAVVPCDRCGRFLCALCDIDPGGGGRHVCPGCLEAARLEPGRKGAEAGDLPMQRRTLHDQMALMLVGLPLVLSVFSAWVFTIITAPVALFLVVRYWNEPRRAIIPRTRARLVLAGVLALLQIGGWVTLLVLFLNRHPHALG